MLHLRVVLQGPAIQIGAHYGGSAFNRNASSITTATQSTSDELTRRELLFGRVLSVYLDDPSNLFVISSDFCHWGEGFRYTPYDAVQVHV